MVSRATTIRFAVLLAVFSMLLALAPAKNVEELSSADDSMDLAPELSDADGNVIEDVQLNWTIDGSH